MMRQEDRAAKQVASATQAAGSDRAARKAIRSDGSKYLLGVAELVRRDPLAVGPVPPPHRFHVRTLNVLLGSKHVDRVAALSVLWDALFNLPLDEVEDELSNAALVIKAAIEGQAVGRPALASAIAVCVSAIEAAAAESENGGIQNA